MQLPADQDVYHITVMWLRDQGHDVVTAMDLGMQRAADEELLNKAEEAGRLFITRDKDFASLVFLRAAESAGVILLRMMPLVVEEVHRELARLFSAHNHDELSRAFCVVEPHRYRIRRLPAR